MFSDFSLVLLPTVSGGLSKLEGILEADGIGIVLQKLPLNQHSTTSRIGRGKLGNASLVEHHISVRRAELFDHRRRVHPFALLFARLRRCRRLTLA